MSNSALVISRAAYRVAPVAANRAEFSRKCEHFYIDYIIPIVSYSACRSKGGDGRPGAVNAARARGVLPMARSGLAVVNSNGFNGGARGAAGACRSLLISPVRAISAAAQNPLVNINENTSAAAPTKVWAETEAFEIASKNTSAESGAVQHASKITSRNKRGGLPTLGFCRRSLQIVA